MEKETFILRTSYLNYMEDFTPEEVGQLMLAVLRYQAEGTLPEKGALPAAAALLFKVIKDDLDYNAEKYAQRCKAAAENGKKGGAPLGNRNAAKRAENNPNQAKQPKTTLYEYDNENEHEGVIEAEADCEYVQKAGSAPQPPKKEAVLLAYEEMIGRVSKRTAQVFAGFPLPDELKIRAIEKACDSGARSMNYIKGVLNGYVNDGVKTLADAQRIEQEYRRKRSRSTPPERTLDEQALAEMRKRLSAERQ